jgi:hypothetical protein
VPAFRSYLLGSCKLGHKAGGFTIVELILPVDALRSGKRQPARAGDSGRLLADADPTNPSIVISKSDVNPSPSSEIS